MFEIKGKYTTAKVMIDNVEESCVSQIFGFVNNSSFTEKIAIMPDTHAGKGSVIGFTMPLTERVIPNVIGVDIGCGMLSFNIGNKLPMSLAEMDDLIRDVVPFGFDVHNSPVLNMKKDFEWKELNEEIRQFAMAYNRKFYRSYKPFPIDYQDFKSMCNSVDADSRRAECSLGTLGGGNHFIEIGQDNTSEQNYWITVHTGSRNLGKQICDAWQDIAWQTIQLKDIKDCSKEHAYLEGEDGFGYLYDMIVAQHFSKINRKCIMNSIIQVLGIEDVKDSIETIHNFIDPRDFIIRKGSVRSYEGERFVLPFNMRDGILICEGKSNEEWNCSAPHGAGRVLSRGQAKRELDVKEFRDQMKDVYSTSVCQSTLDEAPNAYKDSKIIEEAIEPTAKILFKIRPIVNMKSK